MIDRQMQAGQLIASRHIQQAFSNGSTCIGRDDVGMAGAAGLPWVAFRNWKKRDLGENVGEMALVYTFKVLPE